MSFDSHPFRRKALPDVVKNLLIINGIFFGATYLLANQGFNLTDILGLHYFEAPRFKTYQVISYMFMHGGFWHIALNMFALWMFGSAIEHEWGPKRFLIYYFICGIGAAIVQNIVIYYELRPVVALLNDYISSPSLDALKGVIVSDDVRGFISTEAANSFNAFLDKFNSLYSSDPQAALALSAEYMQELRGDIYNAPVTVGASGAVFGLLLAYGMTFPNNLIYIYGIIPLKAKYLVVLYGLFELYSGIHPTQGSNIAHFAHLGGLVFGFFVIIYWRSQDRNKHDGFQEWR